MSVRTHICVCVIQKKLLFNVGDKFDYYHKTSVYF